MKEFTPKTSCTKYLGFHENEAVEKDTHEWREDEPYIRGNRRYQVLICKLCGEKSENWEEMAPVHNSPL